LPAHGRVGARATSFLAAHFAKQNTNSVGVQSEGEAEGGVGGIPPRPSVPLSGARRLCQISLFGFVYQIWQNDFKSLRGV
jgi:hypothetical protein